MRSFDAALGSLDVSLVDLAQSMEALEGGHLIGPKTDEGLVWHIQALRRGSIS